jgi:hypothetical protein
MVIEFRFGHPAKTELPRYVTVFGIDREVIPDRLAKALSPKDVTESPPIVEGIVTMLFEPL